MTTTLASSHSNSTLPQFRNILVIGGSGKVASLIMPALSALHTVRIFDLQPPASLADDATSREGNVSDGEALLAACEGMDTLMYLAMGSNDWSLPVLTPTSFDVNVKGVYLALQAAQAAGIRHAVYASSMSIYEGDLYRRHFADEEITPDSKHVYGFTKLLGEECCRVAVREWDLSINALRLCLPVDEEKWMREVVVGTPTIMTTAQDVSNAMLAAIEYRGNGFSPFMISGDYEQKIMNMSRAKRVLGWEPLARPTRTS